MSKIKFCVVDIDSMTAKFGGPLSKPENIFTGSLVELPTKKYYGKIKECEGGGWYSMKKGIIKEKGWYAIYVNEKHYADVNAEYGSGRYQVTLKKASNDI